MSYVVASKAKEFIGSKDMMMSGELAEALSTKTEETLEAACKRAAANGRKTVRAEDL